MSPGRTLVVGPNGAGKTNLLEGLHVATQGFSPRTRADNRVVRFGEQAARASASGAVGGARFEACVTVPARGAKTAVLNGAATTTEKLRQRLPVLVFVPDRLAVVKGGPLVRRLYFDRMLGRLRPQHGNLPGEYANVLAQRNTALRRIAAGLASRKAIEPWDAAVSRLGTALDLERSSLVGTLEGAFGQHCGELGIGGARLEYAHRPVELSVLEERFAQDLEHGSTGIGPHRRDVLLTSAGQDLRSYGSQGQQRVAVLGLLLAEARVLSETRGLAPILLLDDVLSELDGERRRGLLASLAPDSQTVITTTTLDVEPAAMTGDTAVVSISPGSAAIEQGA